MTGHRRLRFALPIALVAVVLAACSGGGDDPEAAASGAASPAAAGASPTPGPNQNDVATWVGDDLPKAAGGMARRGDLGIYFADVDHRYTLVAIDLTTGTERWRQRVHQHTRVPGTVPAPSVDWDRGLVFATRYNDNTQARSIVAFDLDGKKQWAKPVRWVNSIRLCGDLVCAALSRYDGGGIDAFDRDTGKPRPGGVDGGLERVISHTDPWMITADSQQALGELGRLGADGSYDRQWRRPFAELFDDDQAGVTYTPDGGWYGNYDEDTDTAGIAFGVNSTEDISREEAAQGWAVSLVGGGEVRGSWLQVDPCMGSDTWQSETVVLCEDLEVVDDGLIIGGTPLPRGFGTRASAYGVADGQQQWTTELPGPAESVALTSDERLFIVYPDGADPVLLNIDDGDTVAVSDAPNDLVVACEEGRDEDDRGAVLNAWNGEQNEYLRVSDGHVSQLCDATGDVVDPSAFLESEEPTPRWFGYRPDDEEAGDDVPQGADRWAVWATSDGTLHGAGPADEAS